MDLDRIEALVKLMREHRVAELAYESEGISVRVRLAAEAPPAEAPAQAPRKAAPPAAEQDEGLVIASPMVGTFYRSAKPGEPPYVEVGDRVRKGQVLCIVEAMKLMNELESEYNGTVAEIMAESGQPVQFGQPLFRIVPH